MFSKNETNIKTHHQLQLINPDKYIPKAHKFYLIKKVDNSLNTFRYKNEVNEYIILGKRNPTDYEFGIISKFKFEGIIIAKYLNVKGEEREAHFYNVDSLIPFLKKTKNIISIDFDKVNNGE